MSFTPNCDFEAKNIEDLNAAKAVCRKQAALRREKLAIAEPNADVTLADHASLLLSRYGRGVVAGYVPIRSELSPLVLLDCLADYGCELALPITPPEGQPLTFHRWLINGQLDNGPYGTKQPPKSNKVFIPDVILAPMLAFDLRGWRLGYGGGFYDRTLASLRDAGHSVVLIGIAYAGQKLDKIPVGCYDIPMDAVLGPAGLLELK